MTEGISPLSPQQLPLPPTLAGAAKADAAQGSSFQEFLKGSLEQVNAMQTEADQAVETLVTGGDIRPAEVLTAVQKADVAFRMLMQIRNKMVQAYDEVRNIRV